MTLLNAVAVDEDGRSIDEESQSLSTSIQRVLEDPLITSYVVRVFSSPASKSGIDNTFRAPCLNVARVSLMEFFSIMAGQRGIFDLFVTLIFAF